MGSAGEAVRAAALRVTVSSLRLNPNLEK